MIKTWAVTDTGLVRKENQDTYRIARNGDICVVCDGMGGAAGGRLASTLASETYAAEMEKALKPDMTPEQLREASAYAVAMANRAVAERAEAEAALAEMERKHQTARVRIIKALLEQTVQDMDYAAAQKELGLTAATARKLMELGLIRIESDTIFRNPVRPSEVQAHPFTLYPAQQAIVEDVAARAAAGDLRPSLIHGVTGSGKTEV